MSNVNDIDMEENSGLTGRKKLRSGEYDYSNTNKKNNINQKAILEEQEQLDREFDEDVWADFEKKFAETNIQIQFSIDGNTAEIGENEHWSLLDFKDSIVEECKRRGINFEDNNLQIIGQTEKILVGRPKRNDRYLWRVLRHGYIMLAHIMVWINPMYTGRANTNLSMVELEYNNRNTIQITQLQQIMHQWGAVDFVVVSHNKNGAMKVKWPAITCVTAATQHYPTIMHSFRIFFESEGTANKVYDSYIRDAMKKMNERAQETRTINLKLVRFVEWNAINKRMVRATSEEQAAICERSVHVIGLGTEVSSSQLERFIRELGYVNAMVASKSSRGKATVVMDKAVDANKFVNAYGLGQTNRIVIGNIKMFAAEVDKPGIIRCFTCYEIGHMSGDCQKRKTNLSHSNPWRRSDQGNDGIGYARGSMVIETGQADGKGKQMVTREPTDLRLIVNQVIQRVERNIESQVNGQVRAYIQKIDDRFNQQERELQRQEQQLNGISNAVSILERQAGNIEEIRKDQNDIKNMLHQITQSMRNTNPNEEQGNHF